jgi:hypothetical protein
MSYPLHTRSGIGFDAWLIAVAGSRLRVSRLTAQTMLMLGERPVSSF